MKSFNLIFSKLKIPKFILSFIASLKSIIDNKAFVFSIFSLFIKTILLLILTSSDTGSNINIKTIFYSVPPLLVYLSFFVIFLSFSYLFKGKGHLISLFVLNIILTIIVISDVLYFRANSSFLSLHLFSYTSNLENLSGSIFSLFRLIDSLFLIDIIILGIYLSKKSKLYTTFKRNIYKFLILLILPLIYLGYSHVKVDNFKQSFLNQTLFENSWSQNQTMSNLTPIGYHLFDIYNYLIDLKPYNLSDTDKKDLNTFFEIKKEYSNQNKYKGMFKGKNLIILQVESLENFVIGKSINGQEITPNINKLLNNSIYFNNFLEQTKEGTTSDAEFMCNTSILPVNRGSTFFRFSSNTYKASLPNLMKEEGYSTIAVHPDKGSYWNWLSSLKSIGFDKCVDSSSLKIDDTVGLGLSDKSFLPQFANIIEKQPKPFYSFGITLTSHTPYNLPDNKITLNLPSSLKNTVMGSYLESINYTDSAIGDFINILDKKGILENSVLVVYGDHEGVHKYFSDDIQALSLDPWMKNNNYKVPFIIYSKNIEAEKISTAGGQIDILPTISYLMDINSDKYKYTIGRNLLNTNLNYTYSPSGKMHQYKMPSKIKSILEQAPEYSDMIIRSNYFRKE